MKVYLVWYKRTFGTMLWGVCRTVEKAKELVEMIKKDYGCYADWTDETLIED